MEPIAKIVSWHQHFLYVLLFDVPYPCRYYNRASPFDYAERLWLVSGLYIGDIPFDVRLQLERCLKLSIYGSLLAVLATQPGNLAKRGTLAQAL